MAKALLIAEIGGSSSRWAWLNDGGASLTLPIAGDTLPGFNPVNGNATLFSEGIRDYFRSHAPDTSQTPAVMVYGAGCGSERRRAIMRDAIASIWPHAGIKVETDLLGAARGLCGAESGLVLILGTGMNIGWYDGERLFQPMPSLGYVLGDEGSGADIGRTLLQDAFYERMPGSIRTALFGVEGPQLERIIDEVYRSPFPAKALAARTALLPALVQESYVRDLLASRFHALVETMVPFFTPEQRVRVYATGSVAWGFRELLAGCLLDHGMELTHVERDPLSGLEKWHRPRER